jgi:hypothetical protein
MQFPPLLEEVHGVPQHSSTAKCILLFQQTIYCLSTNEALFEVHSVPTCEIVTYECSGIESYSTIYKLIIAK